MSTNRMYSSMLSLDLIHVIFEWKMNLGHEC